MKQKIDLELDELRKNVEIKSKDGTDLIRQSAFFILGLIGVLVVDNHENISNQYIKLSLFGVFLCLLIDILQSLTIVALIDIMFKKFRKSKWRKEDSGILYKVSKKRNKIYNISRVLFYFRFILLLFSLCLFFLYVFDSL